MKGVIIDTNVLISFVSDRNIDQQEQAAQIFKKAAALKHEILCHLNVISEFVYVLEKIYGIRKEKIRELVFDLQSMPGLKLEFEISIETLLSYWPSKIPDYGDAILAALCMKSQKTSIATFDENFRKNLLKHSIPVFNL